MVDKIKINYAGEEVEAMPIEINQGDEHWNQYLLDDGTTLKVKLVTTRVLRIENKYDHEGNPIYLVQSTNVLAVNSPLSLKRKI